MILEWNFLVIGHWPEWVYLVAGQISLPGGKAEEGDRDDGDTATQEAKEEIGLDPPLVEAVTVLEQFFSKQSSRTSHLLNHIDRCPKRIQESAPAPAPASSPSQASKVYKKKDAETSVISAFDPTAFDKALARQKIARIIIMHELPLRFVEYEGFRDLMSFVQPLLDQRLSTITIDSCSTNDAMIPLLLAKFPPGSFLLNGKLLHVRCCAHILNLIVKDGLDAIGDGIEKVRNSVNYWTSSPKRIELFEDTANRQLKLNCSKSLVLDCKTKWNSTYLMLEVALIYKDVFTRLKHRDNQYKHLPTEVEWELARVFSCDGHVGCAKFNAFKSQHICKRVKSKLDTYLEEEDKTTPDFDILMWWKVNRSRYLILSEIARDLLVVPVSTIASEYAFSAGGKIPKDKVMNGEEINGEVTDNDDEEETQPCSE
ncbi:BED-type domain-containing protein [Citrus sinensis]|nr:BED-type domain-containing protein [Citrus sinensis]